MDELDDVAAGQLLGERGTVSHPAEPNATRNMWRVLEHGFLAAFGWLGEQLSRVLGGHRHKLVPVRVSYPRQGSVFTATSAGTLVLLRCPCGEGPGHLYELRLQGIYTLDQVRGLDS